MFLASDKILFAIALNGRKEKHLKTFFSKLYWFCKTQIGIDPRPFIRSLIGLPGYIRDLAKFKSSYAGVLKILPCLQDKFDDSGYTKSEYFWQDLIVAKTIFARSPQKHVDVGSRIDGFVAHLASFREIEVLDIRPLSNKIPGVIFKQADLMNPLPELENYCDSFSCLHTLEHFGLGRYGDPVLVDGFKRGLENMVKILKPEGTFYLSVPIGVERVEFNANRVFSPTTVIELCKALKLEFSRLQVIENSSHGMFYYTVENSKIEELASKNYSLGIFEFIKQSDVG